LEINGASLWLDAYVDTLSAITAKKTGRNRNLFEKFIFRIVFDFSLLNNVSGAIGNTYDGISGLDLGAKRNLYEKKQPSRLIY